MSTIDTIAISFPHDCHGMDGAAHTNTKPASRGRFATVAISLLDWFQTLPARRMTRRALMELTDEQLKDIGLMRDRAREGRFRDWRFDQ